MHKILIPIDPSEYTKTAYQYVLKIASNNKVSIEGIVIIDNLDIAETASTYLPLPLGNEEHLKQEETLFKAAKKQARDLIKMCKKTGLECDSQLIAGRPDFVIEEAGKYTDLIVIGMRNFFHFETSDMPEKTVSKIIYHSQAPVLMVPKKFKPVNKVLIAFDGSNPSVKATREFAKIAWNKTFEITLLVSHSSRSEGNKILEKLENYLTKHTGAKIERQYSDKNIISVYEEEYSGNVDLVVCGMHSQNIVEKLFVGSFPEHLINENSVPVLMVQ